MKYETNNLALPRFFDFEFDLKLKSALSKSKCNYNYLCLDNGS